MIVQTSSGKLEKIVTLLKEKLHKENLQTLHGDVVVEIWDNTRTEITLADVKKSEADLFVNFNLSGFEKGTLTGGISYNLLNCKQIHILLDDKLPNERYLSKQLSIAMFFYCVGSEYYQSLADRYPDIPYLKEINGWNSDNTDTGIAQNAGILCDIVWEVAKICHIAAVQPCHS